jgi:DNA-binding NarL/FixJ family response regulator
VVCPYPVVNAGLARALGEAGVRHGPRPPDGDVSHCVLLWADGAEGLPETLGRLQEASPDAPILVFAQAEDLSLARDALQAGARGFVHAGMRPDQTDSPRPVGGFERRS